MSLIINRDQGIVDGECAHIIDDGISHHSPPRNIMNEFIVNKNFSLFYHQRITTQHGLTIRTRKNHLRSGR